ncbi:glycosyltransferase involved in cell wall biosynthesis [Neolewinella xylanilytica]|uniref:Glycosyltransferase involved in cell wall biosynthesis n=1 Tax=Neolewinella xylanilytica TaxID=1514080 RepID=A0A2S6I3R2_9BACT|nr:glycosyltransferase family 2 protein [Neolewinella xylanilytica]PPK85828.1 glycosyltransferase involved in cell wall biosynthesis [Neolewinella xylanilytica]
MDISVVVPLFNEQESLPELTAWIDRVMQANGYSYEVWLVDDGSNDDSWQVITALAARNDCLKGIKFQRNYGKSPALNVGFQYAAGDVIITMDADLQDSPDEIPFLYQMVMEEGYDVVSGWKKDRKDPLGKTLPSKFFNFVTRKVSGIRLHDFNCGLKSYRRNVIKSIEVYGDMHRHMPLLAKWAGFRKIGERVVEHRPRKYGTSKFGLSRLITGFLDLLTLMFVGKFGKRPMHLFGTIGTIMFLIGFVASIVIGTTKVYALANNMPMVLVTNNPWFYISLTTMVMGTILFVTGFLAELVARSNPDRNHYLVETVLDA